MKKIVLLLIAPALYACSPQAREKKDKLPEVPVTSVVFVDTSSYTEYPAEIHAVQNVEIRARVSGYLENIYTDEGKYVLKDQLLFSINGSEYAEQVTKTEALYKNAKVDLEAAQLEYKSAKILFDKDVISETRLRQYANKIKGATNKVQETKADFSRAQLRLAYARIKAPFNGVLNRIPHKIGSLVNEGTLLTTISQDDEVFAYFDVSEKEYLNYTLNLPKNEGQYKTASLVLANGMLHTQPGKIETIEGEVNQATGNIAFRARFKNPSKLLKHGASGKVRLKNKFRHVIIIPQKSTFEIQDKIYIYILDKDNIVRVKNIKPVSRIPHLYILKDDLLPGEKVIYEGLQKVQEGLEVKPRFVEMRKILNELTNHNI